MLDLRRLFSKYRIQWRDTGANCSRGHVNVRCPFCGVADKSFHMSVNESTGEYYCFRKPKHAGVKVGYLFHALNIPGYEYAGENLTPSVRTYKEDNRDYSEWEFFIPASESEEAVNYLFSRNFLNPYDVCKRFDLKVALEGHWVGRLIIPLTSGWTGRAMRNHLALRYLQYSSEESFFYYSRNNTSAIVVEGAIDAMRIATVSSQFDVYAKCRAALSSALISQLKENNYLSIYSAPDGTVDFADKNDEARMLSSYCTKAAVKKVAIPAKDFGAMQESEVRKFLSGI